MKLQSFLLFFSLVLCCLGCQSQQASKSVTNLDSPSFQAQIEKGAQLLDVRSVEEYQGGHLKATTNINIANTTFKKEVEALDKNKPVCVYCQRGSRSAKAANIMAEMGFKEVYNLTGGIEQWESDKMPVEK
ncbi:MAG: rhodanese-like domain-containing protein [Bacteroidia bacterium]